MTNKNKLYQVLKNPMGKIILVDLDNTLCNGTYWVGDDEHPPVNEKMAEFIRSLDDRGAFIVIWTARPIVLMTKTYKWLAKNNINYPLAFRLKPPCDLMLDDKCLNIDDIKY